MMRIYHTNTANIRYIRINLQIGIIFVIVLNSAVIDKEETSLYHILFYSNKPLIF